jgi:hypothetical protein
MIFGGQLMAFILRMRLINKRRQQEYLPSLLINSKMSRGSIAL